MAYENKNFSGDRDSRNNESLYSKRIKAGKRRTYFFDVRATRGNDYFITITESKKRFDDNGYDRHKMFLYKEDFNKFLAGLTDTINYVKTDLMPDFDFDAFSHEHDEEGSHILSHEGDMLQHHMEAHEAPQPVAVVAEEAPELEAVESDGAIEVDAWKM